MATGKKERFLENLEPVLQNAERFALFVSGNREIAKDLLGDAVLIAYENYEQIKNKQALLSYLLTIISRLNRDNYKREKGHINFESQNIETLFAADNPSVDTDIVLMYEAMEKLSPVQKEAVLLKEIYGYSLKEIAKIQNAGVSSVKVRIYRAKKNLRKFLGINKWKI